MTTTLLDLGSILAGLVLLFCGAEILVRSSVSLGERFGLSKLVIGLTIVAFATSAPEIFVSVQAAMKDQGDIALGNVFGSNLANIGLILGLAACIRPLQVCVRSVRLDGPVMVGTGLLIGWMAWDGVLVPRDGVVLLCLLAVLIYGRIQIERKDVPETDQPESGDKPWPLYLAIFGVVIGLLLLATGGDWLVRGALSIAAQLNVPEALVAITVVAIGTSLPELSTSVVAALRGNADVAVGNVLGSNIFNSCGVLGLAALVGPLTGNAFHVEVIATLLLSLALLPLLRTGFRIERWEGALLLVIYFSVIGFIASR